MILPALFCLNIAWAAPSSAAPRHKLAGLVVRSKDWAVHRGTDTVEEWTGDVSYHKPGRDIYSDWAERRHSSERWHAKGHVRAVWHSDDGSVSEARGEEARYDGEDDTGTLVPKPGLFLDFERRSPDQTEPDRARGRKLDWDWKAHRSTLRGDVYAWGPRGEAWSDSAVYYGKEKRVDLIGRRPALTYDNTLDCRQRRAEQEEDGGKARPCKHWNGAVQADVVSALDHPREITAAGGVRGWIVFEDKPAKL